MLFNSLEFLLFFPIVYILYWFVFNKNLRNQNILIMVASYFSMAGGAGNFISSFYFHPAGLFIRIRRCFPEQEKARMFLWLSVVNNLGILGYSNTITSLPLNFSGHLKRSVSTLTQPY